MLVFCEDCGEKNSIDLNAVRSAGNLYRCQSCYFLNQLLVKKVEPANPQKKKTAHYDKVPYLRILQEISREKDILEAYVYDHYRGIIAANVSDNFTDAYMLKIGQALAFCHNMGQKILAETTETYLVLVNKIVEGKRLEKNSMLIMCHTSYPLPPHVTTIINRAIANFQVYKK